MRSGYIKPGRIVGPARKIIESRTVAFDAPLGRFAFVDTDRCLHRAGIPRPGETRAMVQLVFKPNDTLLPSGDYLDDMPRDPNVYKGAIA